MSNSPFLFCGCRENPFGVNPNPRFLLRSAHVERAFEGIRAGIRQRTGLIVLTGEAGTGKTTLLYRLIDSLKESAAPIAFIFNSKVEAGDLWRLMFSEFGLKWIDESKDQRLRRFHEWLLEEYRADRIPLLVIDEAQGLCSHVFTELQSFLDLTAGDQKLLQILLSGQTELDELLKRRELREIRQRVAVWQKTRPLTLDETDAYVRHRASLAGAGDGAIFDDSAVRAIHRCAQGIPRLINLVSERALRDAHGEKLQPVPEWIVRRVARDFQLDDGRPTGTVLHPFLETPAQPEVNAPVPMAAKTAADKPSIEDVEALLTDLRRYRKLRPAPKPRLTPASLQLAARAAVSPVPPTMAARVAAISSDRIAAQAIPASLAGTGQTPAAGVGKRRGALGWLGAFLTMPMPRLLYAREFERHYQQAVKAGASLLEWVGIAEIFTELRDSAPYLPSAAAEVAAALFSYLEFVPNWILSPEWKQRCAKSWGRRRQTYHALLHWLRSPLPF